MNPLSPYWDRHADTYTERDRLEALAAGRRAFAERLEGIRERYEGRNTVSAKAAREVLSLVDDRVIELEQVHADRLAGVATAHAAQVAQLEERVETYKTRCTQLELQLDEKRQLREARAQQGEEVKVTIDRSLGGWVVADLEEIAYRLRCGGAVDDTSVKLTDYSAAAIVPAPDLVRLDRPALQERREPLLLPDPVVAEGGTSVARSVLLRGGALAVLLLVLDVVWRVIA